MVSRLVPILLASLPFLASCSSTAPAAAEAPTEPEVEAPAGDAPEDAAAPVPMAIPGCPGDPGPPSITVDAAAREDPTGGPESFTVARALAGYPESATGTLTALITTEESSIRCELDEVAAPVSVANFVGLARGTRPYRERRTWKVGRFYDGLLWHRVIPEFMIQGGDPTGTGSGGPGYNLPEENHVDEPTGTLAMAASHAPSGSQFFIVVGKGPAPAYNVFGSCTTETAIKISELPRDARDRPDTDVHMLRIDIARCPK
jgi:peptidyl-prolyl cis-trans isomerase A (cyclophilin A)